MRAHHRIVIVGAGFSGLGLAIHLRRSGIEDFVLLERSADVGGTWWDNTYPGVQCDVPSHLYSYSFAPNPDWSRTYSMGPEINEYLRRCAREERVVEHVRFEHGVEDACWDGRRWEITTDGGVFTADVLVAATGGLSEPSVPQLPGLGSFEGITFHSAHWPDDLDLEGKRVAVVGTGASSVQIVPEIQPLVERLDVYQRTPAWVLPHRDRPITASERRLYRRVPALQRMVRAGVYWLREMLVPGLTRDPSRLALIEKQARRHLDRQVADPELRAALTPDFTPGCKRLLLSNRFYPALQGPNVELVTDRIAEVGPRSILTADGTERATDVLVLATGFRTTNHPMMERIRGRDGRSVACRWSETGMRAYLGTTVEGFPNLFLMTGPNTGIGHTSLVYMIEAQCAYVLDALRTMERQGLATVEIRPEEVERFDAWLQERMRGSVWTTGGCASWYLDDRGRNPTLWPEQTWRYRRFTRSFDLHRYETTPA